MTTNTKTSITAAAARSISQDEIVTLDLSDLTQALRAEAVGAGDRDLADMCAVVIDVLTGAGSAEEYADGAITYPEAVAAVMSALRAGAGSLDIEDSVTSGDVEEMWGTDEDGDEWRVHIRLDA